MSGLQLERGYPAREQTPEKLRRWITNDRVGRSDVILFLVKILQASSFWLFSTLKNDKKKKKNTHTFIQTSGKTISHLVYVSM